MSILVFAESSEGKFKKSALEVVSYGKKLAEEIKKIKPIKVEISHAKQIFSDDPDQKGQDGSLPELYDNYLGFLQN